MAQDIDAAVTIAKKIFYKFRVVTLDGQLVNAGGSMTGGSASKSTGLLSRREEIRSLQEQISRSNSRWTAKAYVGAAQQQLAKLGASRTAVQAQLTSCQQDKITYTSEHKRVQMSYEEALRLSEESHREYLQVQAKLEQLKKHLQQRRRPDRTGHLPLADAVQSAGAGEGKTRSGWDRQSRRWANSTTRCAFEMLGLQRTSSRCKPSADSCKRSSTSRTAMCRVWWTKSIPCKTTAGCWKGKAAAFEEKQLLTQQITEQTEQIQQARQQQAQAEQHLTGLRATEKESRLPSGNAPQQSSPAARAQDRPANRVRQADCKAVGRIQYDPQRCAGTKAKPIEDEQRWQNRSTELRNKIRALGTVNLAAIEEYGEVEGSTAF